MPTLLPEPVARPINLTMLSGQGRIPATGSTSFGAAAMRSARNAAGLRQQPDILLDRALCATSPAPHAGFFVPSRAIYVGRLIAAAPGPEAPSIGIQAPWSGLRVGPFFRSHGTELPP